MMFLCLYLKVRKCGITFVGRIAMEFAIEFLRKNSLFNKGLESSFIVLHFYPSLNCRCLDYIPDFLFLNN